MPIRDSTPLSSPDVYISGQPGIACNLGADVAAQRMKARYLYIRLSKRMSENEETYQLHIFKKPLGSPRLCLARNHIRYHVGKLLSSSD